MTHAAAPCCAASQPSLASPIFDAASIVARAVRLSDDEEAAFKFLAITSLDCTPEQGLALADAIKRSALAGNVIYVELAEHIRAVAMDNE